MNRVGLDLISRWWVLLLLAVLCLGTCASGLSTALTQDATPTQNTEEFEGEEAERLVETREAASEQPYAPTRSVARIPNAPPTAAQRLRCFDVERRSRGAYLPLLT